MPNYKLIIEYDGSHFYGWQVQPHLRTVQGELQRALEVLVRRPVTLHCAGRTDRGVHALAQVANFHTDGQIEEKPFLKSLNAITPPDIVIHALTQVGDSFHARFSARARQYIYFLSLKPLAVGRQYAFYVPEMLDVGAMQEATHCLLGEHHFDAFSKVTPEETHYLSHVEVAEWIQQDHRLGFRMRANRFLHHMVRWLVGTLIQVGRGKLTPAEFEAILESRDRRHVGFIAPAHGLFLEKVFYPEDE